MDWEHILHAYVKLHIWYHSRYVVLTLRYYSANENTVAAGKKTILPADVFKALDDTEFSFLKEPLEAEFASTFAKPHP